ncbi:GNAT family N-acetyltransferase [Myxacorys almedinensis]|uniref:GNAT family N-acetyltransferase n=1 Tax=Myxacorys almedinensis A TaxID=2690445 RepID=A0A8J7YXR9_9CYAN|nr:GNAT family N-acetyltransferase [Myxacorys almedinensis]NDJ16499.1 GNAT family N-acetyltransferase [Myxacorys almedinensis A]
MIDGLPWGYRLQRGSAIEHSRLLKVMEQTYTELYPGGTFSHLAATVEQYCSPETPIWWVEQTEEVEPSMLPRRSRPKPIGCLWLGHAIDNATGARHAHIFLLYVAPPHRRQGIGAALMRQAEAWAKAKGAPQIGLQVFETNQPALNLYRSLGYHTQSFWMTKPL